MTLQEALDSAGYTGTHGESSLWRKLAKARESEAIADADLAVTALVGWSQEVTQIDETDVPRPSNVWQYPGEVCGDEALALMRRGETRAMVAAERPARQAGWFRGPQNANIDDYLTTGAQVMDK